METLEQLLKKYSDGIEIVINPLAIPSKTRLSCFVSDYKVNNLTIVINPGYNGTNHGYFISGQGFDNDNEVWYYSPIYFKLKADDESYQEVLNFTKYFIEFCEMCDRPISKLN